MSLLVWISNQQYFIVFFFLLQDIHFYTAFLYHYKFSGDYISKEQPFGNVSDKPRIEDKNDLKMTWPVNNGTKYLHSPKCNLNLDSDSCFSYYITVNYRISCSVNTGCTLNFSSHHPLLLFMFFKVCIMYNNL